MTRDTRIQAIAAVVLVLCLGASAVLSVRMTAIAGHAELAYTDRAEDNDRWEVAAGVAMGAFRGVFVNLLWIRANDQKEAGKYYEAVELAKAITKLQPRFPRVWVFHAWNLAYNISVSTKTREERWNWVNQGIGLLRDRAIPANPNDLLLHKELAWIFLHKIQGVTDDANPYYKRMLAAEWTFNLGQPPMRESADRDRAHITEKYAKWMDGFVNAPATWDDVLREEPKAGELAQRLREGVGLSFDTKQDREMFVQRVEVTRAINSSLRARAFKESVGPRTKALVALVSDPVYTKAWDVLLRHVRRRILIEDYHMDPARMARYTRRFGPIDWRHGAGHSLYWSAKGVEEALTRVVKDKVDKEGRVIEEGTRRDYDFLNTDRIVAQSLQELFRYGDVYFDFTNFVSGEYSQLLASPNPHFADSYGEVLDEMRIRAGVIDQQSSRRAVSPMSAGYENFMIDVTLFFYRRGEREKALKWLEKLRTYDDMNTYDPTRPERFSDLEQFAAREMETRATSTYVANFSITASLMGAYTSGLLAQDPEMFQKQFDYAREFHRFYFEKQGRLTGVNIEQFRTELFDRDFEFVAGPLFAQFVSSLGVDEATYVYAAAPRDLQRWAFLALRQRYQQLLDEEAKANQMNFIKLFPEPPGMEQFMQRIEAKEKERLRRGPAVEAQ